MNEIHRQLGEITATQRDLRDDIRTILEERRLAEVGRRQENEAVTARLAALERTSSEQHRTNTEKLDGLSQDVSKMKEPVEQFVSIKNRASRIGLILISIGGVLWSLAEPIYEFVVTRLMGGDHH